MSQDSPLEDGILVTPEQALVTCLRQADEYVTRGLFPVSVVFDVTDTGAPTWSIVAGRIVTPEGEVSPSDGYPRVDDLVLTAWGATFITATRSNR